MDTPIQIKYDLFYFFNELDMLEIRLNILDPYVDYFILCEANLTHLGVPKESVYLANKERFAKWNHKIIHHWTDDYPNDKDIYLKTMFSPNIGNGEHYWVREFYLKESPRKSLTHLKDDDVVYISDVDEIWNYKLDLDLTKDVVYKPKQKPYLFHLNNRTDEDWLGWSGTTICKYRFIKNGIINHIRTDELQQYEVVENGGWHFCSLGTKDEKQNNDKHPMYSDEGTWKRRMINMRKDESDLPEYILNNKEKWKKYLL
jgi:beta-1,4-mannosyl-glycoprotein beta-1,4-N-acetylglucosaminyltransferase